MNVELTLKGANQDELENNMAKMLRRCGWICMKGGHWEAPKAVRARYGISDNQATRFHMQLKRFRGDFPKRMGPSGNRILEMQVTPLLHEYLTRFTLKEKL